MSDANFACVTAAKPPDNPGNAGPWVAGVTVNVVRTYFRRNKTHLRWLNREVDVEEVAASELHEGPLDDRVNLEWLLETWLDRQVAKFPTDKQTLEIIRHKARTGQTDEEIVAHFQLSSVSALSSRIHYFKKKYEHRRKRYLAQRRRNLMLIFKLGAAAVAAGALAIIAWLLWHPRLEITREPPAPSAAPSGSASADAGPPPLDQALPPEEVPPKLKP